MYQPGKDLSHQDPGILAFLFLGNSQLVGTNSQEVIEGLSDQEITLVLETLGEAIEKLPKDELIPFDAYPFSTVLDPHGDEERASELGISTEKFRERWNKVLALLRRTLFGALSSR